MQTEKDAEIVDWIGRVGRPAPGTSWRGSTCAGSETAITGYAETGNTAFTYNNLSQVKELTPRAGAPKA